MKKNFANIISNDKKLPAVDKIKIYKSIKISIIFIFSLFLALYIKKEMKDIENTNDHYLISSKNY